MTSPVTHSATPLMNGLHLYGPEPGGLGLDPRRTPAELVADINGKLMSLVSQHPRDEARFTALLDAKVLAGRPAYRAAYDALVATGHFARTPREAAEMIAVSGIPDAWRWESDDPLPDILDESPAWSLRMPGAASQAWPDS